MVEAWLGFKSELAEVSRHPASRTGNCGLWRRDCTTREGNMQVEFYHGVEDMSKETIEKPWKGHRSGAVLCS